MWLVMLTSAAKSNEHRNTIARKHQRGADVTHRNGTSCRNLGLCM
jgi:hypothetical protein